MLVKNSGNCSSGCDVISVVGSAWTDGRLVGNTQCNCVSTESCHWTILSLRSTDILQRTLSRMCVG